MMAWEVGVLGSSMTGFQQPFRLGWSVRYASDFLSMSVAATKGKHHRWCLAGLCFSSIFAGRSAIDFLDASFWCNEKGSIFPSQFRF